MPSLVCFLNKVDAIDDPELLELVEMELRGRPGFLRICCIFICTFTYVTFDSTTSVSHSLHIWQSFLASTSFLGMTSLSFEVQRCLLYKVQMKR